MHVDELTSTSIGDWDAYVAYAEDGHPFQLSGWRDIMRACYGYRDWYLMAHENGKIKGVLPLYKVRSVLVGTSITSLPRGISAESPEAAQALLEKAEEITHAAHVGSLIVRDSRRCWGDGPEWCNTCTVAICNLPNEVAELNKTLKRQLLQHIRKAGEAGVETVTRTGRSATLESSGRTDHTRIQAGPSALWDATACDLTAGDLDAFYNTFCDLLHEKGIPVFGRKVVDEAVKWLPDHVAVTTASVGGEAIGAILHMTLKDTVFATWGGSPIRYRDYRASHALWWESMTFAVSHGYRHLDMGRSPCGSGSEQFKSRWGSQLEPVYKYRLSLGGREVYDPMEDDCVNMKYEVFTKIWMRLPPVVTRVIGPWLRRHMPFA